MTGRAARRPALPGSTELSQTLLNAQEQLGSQARIFCIDAENKSVVPFVTQVKSQLRWRHVPLPVFVFFNQSSIVLPAKAGSPSIDQLVKMTRHRFKIPAA